MEVQSVQDLTEEYFEPKVWAKLAASSPKYYESADIMDEVFNFGKNDNPNLVNKKENDLFKSCSKEHFTIKKIGNDVYLHDLSKYGTFLNQSLIGKGNYRKLDHNDKISVVANNFPSFAFTFVRLEREHQLSNDFETTMALEENQKFRDSRLKNSATVKPTENPTGKPTENPTEKQTKKPTEKSTEKLIEKPTEKSNEKSTTTNSKKPRAKSFKRKNEAPTPKAKRVTRSSSLDQTKRTTRASSLDSKKSRKKNSQKFFFVNRPIVRYYN